MTQPKPDTSELRDTKSGPASSPLLEASARLKIQLLRNRANSLLVSPLEFEVPEVPARDVQVLPGELHPPRPGLHPLVGRARLVHDLASIELQAMELAVRTLIEFPNAPIIFREELLRIALSEAEHFEMCLDTLEAWGMPWGSWPVHLGLWACVRSEDSLLDRLLIVHRYLEGSGLDAGDAILRRIYGLKDSRLDRVVGKIVADEIGHVEFGNRWYRALCAENRLDSQSDFAVRMARLSQQIPRRNERISRLLRSLSGFSEHEILVLEGHRLASLGKHAASAESKALPQRPWLRFLPRGQGDAIFLPAVVRGEAFPLSRA